MTKPIFRRPPAERVELARAHIGQPVAVDVWPLRERAASSFTLAGRLLAVADQPAAAHLPALLIIQRAPSGRVAAVSLAVVAEIRRPTAAEVLDLTR